MSQGVILYGPPAVGKDTITRELAAIDSRYVHFRRLKVGAGHTSGYRVITEDQLTTRRHSGDLLYCNHRYGATYAVDRFELDTIIGRGQVPVVHLGQIDGVRAVLAYPAVWLSVLMWCSRHVTEQRARQRGSDDIEARLAAWDETASDLYQNGTEEFSLRIDTDQHTPTQAARLIHGCRMAAGSY